MFGFCNILKMYADICCYYIHRSYIEVRYQIEKNTNNFCTNYATVIKKLYDEKYNIIAVYRTPRLEYKSEAISENLISSQKNKDILFYLKTIDLNNSLYYKKFNTIDELLKNDNIITTNDLFRPFISMTINLDGTSIDIYDNASKFFIIDNMIFNKNFVTWFMKEYYNMNIHNKTYKILMVDYQIQEININETQELAVEKNSYTIKTI